MNEITIIVAKYLIVLSVLLTIFMFVEQTGRQAKLRFLALLIVGGIVSFILSLLGSHLIHNPRPFVVGHFTPLIPHAADNGFPSDHVLLASFIGWLLLAYSKRWGVVALGIAVLLGAARVHAGVHHITDIVGSFVISGIGFLLTYAFLKLIGPPRKSQTPQVEA